MRRIRGFAELYLAIAIAIGAIALLAGVYFYGRSDGKVIEKAAWEARENEKLARANKRIQELQTAARELERAAGARLAAISAAYQEELTGVRNQTNDRVDAAVRGALRLRDPAAPIRGTCRDPPAPAALAAGGRDARPEGELSAAATRFLLELTGDADSVVDQLTAAQAVIKVCEKAASP